MLLEMDVLDPRMVLVPQLHQTRGGWMALIVHAQRAIAKADHEQMPNIRIARERCRTRIHMRRHIGNAQLAVCIPQAHEPTITSCEQAAIHLLPVDAYATRVTTAQEVRERAECAHELGHRTVIASEQVHVAIRRRRQQQGLHFLVDEGQRRHRSVRLRCMAERAQEPVVFPVPHTQRVLLGHADEMGIVLVEHEHAHGCRHRQYGYALGPPHIAGIVDLLHRLGNVPLTALAAPHVPIVLGAPGLIGLRRLHLRLREVLTAPLKEAALERQSLPDTP